MQSTGNTILVTGGGSGLGRAFAEAFHKLGNQVIIAGRRKDALNAVTAANPGMASIQLNVEDPASIRAATDQLAKDFPALNVLFNNAGVMRAEDVRSGKLEDAEATITTNLLGPIRLTLALLPLLQKQSQATVLNVSSGLAFVPMAVTPTYNATKAAIHSWTQSLRYQLKDTQIQVIEVIPPYVQTELMGARQASDPRAMPLKDFISETMEILKTQPNVTETIVERVKPLRFAAESGNYDAFFKKFNDAMLAPH